nr:reverse transcriptase domain-containing protein [Tanacetum cinerariifolium]
VVPSCALALVSASKRLKRYFQAHTIVVITDQPIKQLLSNPEVTGRLLKWRFELGEHDIQYRPRTSVKGQILADLIVERPEDDTTDTSMKDREELPDPWILFTDESSCIDEYEALIAGLQIAGQMGVQNLQANVDSKLVANQEKLTPITSPWPFYKWGIDIAEPFLEGPDKVKFLIVAMDYFTKWIEARTVETITGPKLKTKAVIPAEIVMPTLRTAKVDIVKNNEALGISLDLLEENREQAAAQEARSKAKMERYYNARVRKTSVRPGDFIYRNNEASHVEDGGKLGPKWADHTKSQKH